MNRHPNLQDVFVLTVFNQIGLQFLKFYFKSFYGHYILQHFNKLP